MSTIYVNTVAPQSGTTVTVSNKFAVTGTMHAAGIASGSVAGPGSYIALNPSNQLVLTASGGGGITQANQGNNRVITSVDADNINAEANLSFDGTDLTLAGNVSGSGTAQFVGATTLGNTLNVTGATTVAAISGSGTAQFVGATTLGNSLSVSGGINQGGPGDAGYTNTLNGTTALIGAPVIWNWGGFYSAGITVQSTNHGGAGALSVTQGQYQLAPTAALPLTLGNPSPESSTGQWIDFVHAKGSFAVTLTPTTTLGPWDTIITTEVGQGYRLAWVSSSANVDGTSMGWTVVDRYGSGAASGAADPIMPTITA
jgi:hypothetical protein